MDQSAIIGRYFGAAGILLSLVYAPALSAQTTDPLSQFLACAQIENAQTRYACYDATAATVQESLELSGSTSRPMTSDTGPVTRSAPVTPAATPLAGTEQAFGLGPNRPVATTEGEFGLRPDPETTQEVTTVSGKINDFRISGTGRLTVLLDNGQVWRQISGDNTNVSEQRMKRQTTARIETAAFGTYLMTLKPANQAVRVRRLR